jgi:hypothetical protein
MIPVSPVATGLAVLEMAQAGRFAEIRDLFAPNLRSMVSVEALQTAWAAELARRGPMSSVGTPVSEPAQPGVVVVKVPVSCERGALTLVVSVSEAGLTGLQLAPASAAEPVAPWEPPAYADPSKFDEQDVTVGSGPLAVPGALSLPHGPGPLPAVVLLGGSGPLDRDETIGRNKPFKDLAWGLASRGVAVLRFDKVTYAHGSEVKSDPDFTVADEYVPHRRSAAAALGRRSAGPLPRLAGPRDGGRGPTGHRGDEQAGKDARQPPPLPVDAGQRAALRRACLVLAGPARIRPGRGRRGAGQADPHPAGRP